MDDKNISKKINSITKKCWHDCMQKLNIKGGINDSESDFTPSDLNKINMIPCVNFILKLINNKYEFTQRDFNKLITLSTFKNFLIMNGRYCIILKKKLFEALFSKYKPSNKANVPRLKVNPFPETVAL